MSQKRIYLVAEEIVTRWDERWHTIPTEIAMKSVTLFTDCSQALADVRKRGHAFDQAFPRSRLYLRHIREIEKGGTRRYLSDYRRDQLTESEIIALVEADKNSGLEFVYALSNSAKPEWSYVILKIDIDKVVIEEQPQSFAVGGLTFYCTQEFRQQK